MKKMFLFSVCLFFFQCLNLSPETLTAVSLFFIDINPFTLFNVTFMFHQDHTSILILLRLSWISVFAWMMLWPYDPAEEPLFSSTRWYFWSHDPLETAARLPRHSWKIYELGLQRMKVFQELIDLIGFRLPHGHKEEGVKHGSNT